jgi:hypothetical protein
VVVGRLVVVVGRLVVTTVAGKGLQSPTLTAAMSDVKPTGQAVHPSVPVVGLNVAFGHG